ncbi:MAG: hypothetical protein HONBIEJF_00506 [Fimbriimonadaceae bacterium]|nr:hypothetical protein [Fimbriimonadaceae bacterium]
MLRSLGLLVSILAAGSGFAQSFIGTYKGKMTVDRATVSANLTPEQKQMVEKALKDLDKMKLTLTISKDKTFKLVSVGGPQTAKSNSSSGTWAQTGKSLKLTFKTVNDKPISKAQEQTLSIADGGKTLTLSPGQGAGKSKVVFTRS